MKVLFDHHLPFALAHGGLQIQIERTRAALQAVGVEVDFVRWWDSAQRADLIHFWGRPQAQYIRLAQGHGMKVVMGELLTATGSRSPAHLALQRVFIRICRRLLPGIFATRLAWDSYQSADAFIAMTPWEKHLMTYLFEARPEAIHLVPNGVEDVFLGAPAASRGPWLVCTATFTPRKRVVELAEAAVLARTPLWLVGRPYSEADPYCRRLKALAGGHPQLLRTGGPAFEDRAGLAAIYRQARGFVLLSAMESRSLAAEEAAACECPLLLSDLPWARSVFGPDAVYCPISSAPRTVRALRQFYDAAPTLPLPTKPPGEPDIARRLVTIYEGLLS